MASLQMDIAHCLPQEEALTRVKQLLTEARKEQGHNISNLKEEWSNNVGTFSFTAKGFDIKGTLIVTPSKVILDGTIPFAASLFKGKIKEVISKSAKQLLA